MDCSIITLNVLIWSIHDLLWWNPACSFRRPISSEFLIRSNIILLKILLITASRVTPRHFLHWLRSPFFGNFIMIPSFHSLGNFSFCQTMWKMHTKMWGKWVAATKARLHLLQPISIHLSHLRTLSQSLILTLRWLMSYIYGAPILDVSRSHTTTQHSR